MKNAYVMVDHHGDDGTVREGAILRDVTGERFAALEKAGLVREASAAEVSGEKAAEAPLNKAAASPPNKAAAKSTTK